MKLKKHLMRRTLAGLLAAAGTSLAVSAMPMQASAYQTVDQIAGYLGDIDRNGQFDHNDAFYLADYLDCIRRIEDDAKNECRFGDMDGNECINSADLTLLKRMLLDGKTITELEPVYEKTEVPELIAPPVAALTPTLGSVGEKKILMFAVSFPDCQFSEGYSREQIWDIAFGPEKPSSPAYPLESISAYYTRASYGRLNLTGDVYLYTAQKSINSYVDHTDTLLDEIMSAMDSEIDYKKYDADSNGTMDTVLVALPGTASMDDWWPCSGDYFGRSKFDGVKAGNLCIGGWSLSDRSGFNSTWVHELGHAMGLPDYYRYENYQNTEADDYGRGLSGDAGWLMMDDAFGDMSAFDKLMLGWYREDEVQIYDGGVQTYTLQSSQQSPSCLIIPRSDLNGYLSEYFIVECVDKTGNNAKAFYEDMSYDMFYYGGVRILHCNAEIWNGFWGPEWKWNNYGQCYDTSNLKQRVLRLVNNFNGFFSHGELVSSDYSGFAWYDNSGYETVDPGIMLQLGQIANDGSVQVTVFPKQ